MYSPSREVLQPYPHFFRTKVRSRFFVKKHTFLIERDAFVILEVKFTYVYIARKDTSLKNFFTYRGSERR